MLPTIRHCLASLALIGGLAVTGAAAQGQGAMSPGTAPSGAMMAPERQMMPNPSADITTGTVSPRQPQSDQIRGPVEDSLGRTRPGNPSPSVR